MVQVLNWTGPSVDPNHCKFWVTPITTLWCVLAQINQFVFRTLLDWMQEDNEFVGAGGDSAAAPLMELADTSGAKAAAGRR